ncbi:hypothetical protein KIPB_009223 [Kipferlia bialata]|uniref:Reverse transcriptase domain-containing protein n=1 Tax=Kipferlia bialata TaxID=797122 RepID=A0A9K3GM44_9EUKA|nr:hypothetical protein KIPB_009223 [Kipferlia bialata]|eukprot:g9223.t1
MPSTTVVSETSSVAGSAPSDTSTEVAEGSAASATANAAANAAAAVAAKAAAAVAAAGATVPASSLGAAGLPRTRPVSVSAPDISAAVQAAVAAAMREVQVDLADQVNRYIQSNAPEPQPLTVPPSPPLFREYVETTHAPSALMISHLQRLHLRVLQRLHSLDTNYEVADEVTECFHALHLALAAPLDNARVWPLTEAIMSASHSTEWARIIDAEVATHGIRSTRRGRQNRSNRRGGRQNGNSNGTSARGKQATKTSASNAESCSSAITSEHVEAIASVAPPSFESPEASPAVIAPVPSSAVIAPVPSARVGPQSSVVTARRGIPLLAAQYSPAVPSGSVRQRLESSRGNGPLPCHNDAPGPCQPVPGSAVDDGGPIMLSVMPDLPVRFTDTPTVPTAHDDAPDESFERSCPVISTSVKAPEILASEFNNSEMFCSAIGTSVKASEFINSEMSCSAIGTSVKAPEILASESCHPVMAPEPCGNMPPRFLEFSDVPDGRFRVSDHPVPPTGIGTSARLRSGELHPRVRPPTHRHPSAPSPRGLSTLPRFTPAPSASTLFGRCSGTHISVSDGMDDELFAEVEAYLEAGAYEIGPAVAGGHLFGVNRKVGKVRVIHDLSPVNTNAHPPTYRLWAARRAALRLRRGDWLAVLDLKSGYSQVVLSEASRTFCGAILPDERHIRARTLPFGLSASPYLFQRITAALGRYIEARTGAKVVVYIDDFLVASPSRKRLMFALHFIRAISPILGVVWGAKSVWHPSQRARYLGLVIDTVKGHFHVPRDKADEISRQIQFVLALKRVRRRLLLSLAGSIGYLRPAFQQCLLRLRGVQSQAGPSGFCVLAPRTRADLTWFLSHLSAPILPLSPFLPPASPLWLSTDATLKDWGAVLWRNGKKVASVHGIFAIPDHHIMVSEGRALVNALERWSHLLSSTPLLWLCDNVATLAVIAKGSLKAPQALLDIGRQVADWQIGHHCTITARYVQSALNHDADALSRPLDPPPSPLPHWHRLVARFGHPQVTWAKLCPSLLSQLEGGPQGRPWRDRKTLWWESPSRIHEALLLLERWAYPSSSGRPPFSEDPATVIVVMPRWRRAPWFQTLTDLACIRETFTVPEDFELPWGISQAFRRQGAVPKLLVFGIRVRRHTCSSLCLPQMH